MFSENLALSRYALSYRDSNLAILWQKYATIRKYKEINSKKNEKCNYFTKNGLI